MPTFQYKARSRTGQMVQGDIDAESKQEAAQKLMAQGYIPSFFKEKKESFDLSKYFRLEELFESVSQEDLILFTSQLQTLFRAGIPLVACFDGLIDQASKQMFKRILREIKGRLEEGVAMNEAMRSYPSVFSDTYVNMIMAGEVSGTLDESLKRLTVLLEMQFETNQKIKEVLRYPKMVTGAITVAVTVLMTFVVPRFINIFKNARLELPLPTKILIFINGMFLNYWYVLLGAIVVAFILFKQFIATKAGRYQWHSFILRVPIFGDVILKIKFAQFCHVLANLVKSGIPILQSITISARASANDFLINIFAEVNNAVKEGVGMAEPLKNYKVVPPIVIQMIAAGETSGAMDEMLFKVAEYFNQQADRKIKQMSSLIEPIMIFVLGGIVLFIALAIFMPMWDMASMARRGP